MRSIFLLGLVVGAIALVVVNCSDTRLQQPVDKYKVVEEFEAKLAAAIESKDHDKYFALLHWDFKYWDCYHRFDAKNYAKLTDYGIGMTRNRTRDDPIHYSIYKEVRYVIWIKSQLAPYPQLHVITKTLQGWLLLSVSEKCYNW